MNREGRNNIFFRQLDQLCNKYKRKMPRSFQELRHGWANFKGENQYVQVYYFKTIYFILCYPQWNNYVSFDKKL